MKIPINSYKPNSEETLIFDTNVLIKLFYPIDFSGTVESYENLYNEIKKIKAKLIISAIQVSEFINRCIRFQFDLYRKGLPDQNIDFKKEFRETKEYFDNMNAILDIIKSDIIPNFKFVDDEYNLMQYDKIFRYGFSYDFNDSLLVEITKNKNAILVTNDKDFGNYGSDFIIVTDNKTLLMFR